MPSNSIILTSTYLFVVALFLSAGKHNVLGQTTDVRDCQDYTNANTTFATCNDEPGVICSGGCTGYVTAHNCTRSQQVNVQEPPITTENCTLGFGKSSATMYICNNEKFSFTCYGASTGKAQCKGCHKTDGTPQSNVPPVMNGSIGTNDTTMPSTAPANTGVKGASGNNGVMTPPVPTSNSDSNSTTTGSASTTGANVLALIAASVFPFALTL